VPELQRVGIQAIVVTGVVTQGSGGIMQPSSSGKKHPVFGVGARLMSLAAATFVAASIVTLSGQAAAEDGTWYTFNGNLKAQKYAPFDQINRDNVDKLEVIWRRHTGDVSDGSDGKATTVWSATPLFVNDTVYLGTPFYRIFALAPDSGEVKWVYDTKSSLFPVVQGELKNRGVAYWEAETPTPNTPCQKIVYIGTMDATLHAVDADVGVPCSGFGNNGVLEVNAWNTTNAIWPLALLQPPTVVKDTLLLGWAGNDWQQSVTPPGTVFAVDAQTGQLKWTFRSIPEDMVSRTGTANVWASMSADEERNLVYLPVASPSPNYYGGNRTDPIPLATSVTALNIDTGEVAWSRQLVHHDLWDYDTNSAPTLVDIQRNGETVPALVQTSKQGYLYVLNRETGEPIFQIEERKVPASDVPGEKASPTQPHVVVPEPLLGDEWPGIFELADLASFGHCSRVLEQSRDEGRFTPPSAEGTIQWPGNAGGVEWGGGAVDPTTRTFVVNTSVTVQVAKLVPRADYDRRKEFKKNDSGYTAMEGAPYGLDLQMFLNPLGVPCWKPPYGYIAAYSLDTGEKLWQEPFGRIRRDGFDMPESWGTITIGGPAITSGGLIFIGASMDDRVRALDVTTGKVLWQHDVSAPAVSMPAVYMYEGHQYVVFAVGGNSLLSPTVSDEIVAFRLPERE